MEIYRGDRVEHYKGETYQIIEPDAKIEATGEVCVVYGSEFTGEVWIRPLDEFWDEVIYNNQSSPRFKKLDKSFWGD